MVVEDRTMDIIADNYVVFERKHPSVEPVTVILLTSSW